jgi:hypothetical protein
MLREAEIDAQRAELDSLKVEIDAQRVELDSLKAEIDTTRRPCRVPRTSVRDALLKFMML